MTDYEKLKSIIDEIDTLIAVSATSSKTDFKGWKTKAERFLVQKYGKGSFEHTNFRNIIFTPVASGVNRFDDIAKCREGLLTSKIIFASYLDEMNDEEKPAIQPQPVQPINMSKVFIVHGHGGELKHSVARIVEKQGIEAVILSEQANQGRTVIEKFEDNSDVGGAICLFTADDVAKAKDGSLEKPRARQNVVLEAGYFMGKLGRDHVVILADSEIEIPSDLSGVVYTNTSDWKVSLLKDLKAMGYKVDFNKLF